MRDTFTQKYMEYLVYQEIYFVSCNGYAIFSFRLRAMYFNGNLCHDILILNDAGCVCPTPVTPFL